MSAKVLKHHIDLDVLKKYALITTMLFAILIGYILITMPGTGLWTGLMKAQNLTTILFVLVLASSIAGAVFHQSVNYKPRVRNAFAFVFSMSTLKFLGTILFFQLLGLS